MWYQHGLRDNNLETSAFKKVIFLSPHSACCTYRVLLLILLLLHICLPSTANTTHHINVIHVSPSICTLHNTFFILWTFSHSLFRILHFISHFSYVFCIFALFPSFRCYVQQHTTANSFNVKTLAIDLILIVVLL